MLILGAANSAWEMLSSLQPLQPANAGTPAAGIGAGFVTDVPSPAGAAAGGTQSVPQPTGTIGQPSLSPDVLGFLIWNQSQQPGSSTQPWAIGANTSAASGTSTSAGLASGTESATGVTSFAASTPLQSLLSLLGSAGDGTIASSITGAAPGANGSASAGAAPPNPITATAGGLNFAGTDSASASSGTHGGHHHHHGGFAVQSQSDSSDPLANLLGTSAPGTSSATATNADGSTTTTITYADGSEITPTTPAQASNTSPGPTGPAAQPPLNSNDFLETLIQLQARLLTPSAAA
jgi:hypothetical protein